MISNVATIARLAAIFLLLGTAFANRSSADLQKKSRATALRIRPGGALTIATGHPGSVVFINNVRHGVAGENGELKLSRVIAGRFPVRVRSTGFIDWNGTVTITAGSERSLKVPPRPGADQATVHFQTAEQLRDQGKNRDAIPEYEKALAMRAAFPEAHIGATRSLIAIQNFQDAEKHIQAALKSRGRVLAEAQTVLGNLRRSQGLYEESAAEYRKAIRYANGVSAEAHVGLAIALKESGRLDQAINEYRIGILQDMDTEPVLYYQLGEILEEAKRYKEAIDTYSVYLKLDPEGEYASAVESIIDRLKEESPVR
jgi:Tfp pilus assembly protein PilF